ncbi:MAG: hypothetical protein R3301_13215 [Saprospiraceae bacterium]|nr:hypothetical protein [Saprospiraceae bacterium]
MNRLNGLIAVLSLLALPGCIQVSSWQTARTVGEHNGEILVAFGALGISDPLGEDADAGVGTMELMGRYGVSETVDIGLKISSFSSYVFDAKFQVVGDRTTSFGLALGPGIGITAFVGSNGIFQGHLPVHMSVHPSERFAFYFTPRYSSQFTFGDGALHYLGGSLGLEFGRKVKFGLDVSFAELLNDTDADDVFEDFGLRLFQVGFGAKFRIQGQSNND